MRKKMYLLIALLLGGSLGFAQNTVGVLSFDGTQVFDGYNLLYPYNQANVYLLDNCGRVVHEWADSAGVVPGNSLQMREDGSILKTKRDLSVVGDTISIAGGQGEYLEIRDWDNNVTWSYELNNGTYRLHHDAVFMPNGNVLAIAWERFTEAEALAAGRDPGLLKDGELYAETILEIKPIGTDSSEIVWQWRAWDHLIQDYDSTAPNFGTSAQNPGRIDLNFVGVDPGEKDWLHFNGLDYNASLDQIVISCPEFHEIWVIDHSTTTAQAATSSGGLTKRGGDIVFRWGNPQAYGAGDSTDQQLYYQHNPHWINEEVPITDPNYDRIMIFSNREPGDVSSVMIIEPVFDTYDWKYELSGGNYLPAAPVWKYTDAGIYSNILSSGQYLRNGNTLICAGRPGYARELNENDETIWEYKNPIVQGNPATQGDNPALSSNMMFRLKRFSPQFDGFAGRVLTPGDFLELNPDTSLCAQIALLLPEAETGFSSVYPNPTTGTVNILRSHPAKTDMQVFDSFGRLVRRHTLMGLESQLDLSDLPKGIYFLRAGPAAARVVLH